MTRDFKILKLYAKNRKVCEAVKIGDVSKSWLTYAKTLAESLPNTNNTALEQREKMSIKGTEIDDYETLATFYNQRYVDKMILPNEIEKLYGVHHLRFGVLAKGETIPFHLDEPFHLRFICMISGSHKYQTETGNIFNMAEGELWFINGSFKHSITNTSNDTRIALLGKFSNIDTNLQIINELL